MSISKIGSPVMLRGRSINDRNDVVALLQAELETDYHVARERARMLAEHTFDTCHRGADKEVPGTSRRFHHLFIAEKDGVFAGCIHLTIYDRRELPTIHSLLSVQPDAEDVWRKLFEHAETFAHSFDCHELGAMVSTENSAMVTFYQRKGFRTIGVIERYHETAAHRAVLQKKFAM
ncbi:MAG: GNAT family N-acetyltransferase [Candidatus Saccharimonadales bacterium]